MTVWRILVTDDDVTADVLASVEDCVEWFNDAPTMGTEEFIDRLCDSHLADFDLESYNNAAARTIMRHARKIRKESRA